MYSLHRALPIEGGCAHTSEWRHKRYDIIIEFEFSDDLHTIIDSKTLGNAGDKQDKQHVEFHIHSRID